MLSLNSRGDKKVGILNSDQRFYNKILLLLDHQCWLGNRFLLNQEIFQNIVEKKNISIDWRLKEARRASPLSTLHYVDVSYNAWLCQTKSSAQLVTWNKRDQKTFGKKYSSGELTDWYQLERSEVRVAGHLIFSCDNNSRSCRPSVGL